MIYTHPASKRLNTHTEIPDQAAVREVVAIVSSAPEVKTGLLKAFTC